ncbi:S9 family peptidase [Catenulispora rubra]|uniref:S9 family peptidase n=1 Tax=Catenulispora rubra TaxID=280293 RepID=UPI00189237E9|nr:prolyl oligopeptidase family serine peptidase [Catenulispora rubra]
MTTTSPYGTWRSPISAADVARGTKVLGWPAMVGDEVWWSESRPDEGGRITVMRSAADGSGSVELLPAPWYARTRVHEYGGRSWIAIPEDGGPALVFANFADQRVYRLAPGASEPVALTPEPSRPGALRYAELTPSPDGREIWCVRESHSDDHKVSRAFVAIPLSGSGAVRVLGTDTHFLSSPRISPDGRRLAWIGWEHPNMPWDGTLLRVAEIGDGGVLGEPVTVLGGAEESVTQPTWIDDTSLYAVSDRSGWWNLYRVGVEGGDGDGPQALCLRAEEFCSAPWLLGWHTYVVLRDGRIVASHGRGSLALGVLDPKTGELDDLDLPYTSWGTMATDGDAVTAWAASPTTASRIVRVDIANGAAGAAGAAEVVAESVDPANMPDAGYLPLPEAVVSTGPGGREVHANVYPPNNRDFAAPEGELPPYVVHVHGGPTAQSRMEFSLDVAYLTSRGIGVLDVNYGGSTGYGREYRNRLRGQWGVVDVEDSVAAVTGLADTDRADRARLAISGGSAGGWTTLCALVGTDVFACGTSLFGVSDLSALAEDTHDFESRYLDSMVGPLPEAAQIYADRAPVNRVDTLSCPVLLLQGEDDPVVPPSQSEKFAAALADKGIPYAYLLFAGEQHGFRKAENQITSLEAELSFYGQVFGFEPAGIPVVELRTGRDASTGKPYIDRR